MADIAAERLRNLAHCLAAEIAGLEDRPRNIELVAAIARLFESIGLGIDEDAASKWKQPGLSTGLPLQFVVTDRD